MKDADSQTNVLFLSNLVFSGWSTCRVTHSRRAATGMRRAAPRRREGNSPASIIVCHNHPSGAVDASPEDVLVTRQIVEAGKLLDVDLPDHLILSKGRWMSLREKGLGFNNT